MKMTKHGQHIQPVDPIGNFSAGAVRFQMLFEAVTPFSPNVLPSVRYLIWQVQSGHLPANFTLKSDTHGQQITNPLERRDRLAGRVNISHVMPAVRRLLAGAHQTTFPESRQHGRDAMAMDLILDHRLLIGLTDLPADGRHRSPAPLNHAIRCLADVDTYWVQQEESVGFVSSMRKNIEPQVSAVRSTIAWSPNLDGDEVWDPVS